jgi:sulfur carrier protein ThiS
MEKLKISQNGVAAIMINNTDAKPEQELQDGDELTFLTFVAGG